MSEFFDKGKEVQKKFKNIDIFGEFDKYSVEVLKYASITEILEFVKGILDKTRNEVMFIYARSIADEQKNEYIWELLISSFNKIIKGKRKPPWSFGFVSSLIQYHDIKLLKHQAYLIVDMILTYNGEFNTYWFQTIKDKPWFDDLKPYLLKAVLDNLDKISVINIKPVLNSVLEHSFYNDIMEKTDNPKMFIEVLVKYRSHDKNIEGFVGGTDISYMLYKFEEKFIHNERAMTIISGLIGRNYYTGETGKLFVDILNKHPWEKDIKIMWLKKIQDINSKEVNTQLFELTGETKYIPEEVKDIFLF